MRRRTRDQIAKKASKRLRERAAKERKRRKTIRAGQTMRILAPARRSW
jgi:hypothetical protein